MKKVMILISLFTLMLVTVGAQTNDKVTVSVNDLTADQLAKVEAQKKLDMANLQITELQNKIETYGKWVGVGGEVGTAVKEGLSAVVDVADKFGKTDVGKFTLFMVAWKVIGVDIIRIVLGLFFFVVLTIVIVKVYKRVVMARKIVIESNGWMFWKPKKYQVVESKCNGEESIYMTLILLVVFLLGIWITYSIMF